MTLLSGLMLFSAMSCVGAFVMALINLRVYRRPPEKLPATIERPLISVCVPARNEEANIEACVRSVLDGSYEQVEVLVYDDQSTDATPQILARLIAVDDRVRAAETVPLPAGWSGKQHACHRMGEQSRGEWLLFTDADVRFSPDMLERTLAAQRDLGTDLLSTFPRQITGTLGEKLLVPMIFFLLFSYLPMWRMRDTRDPSTSAACGQFLFARAEAYRATGGHAAFKDSYHDGIKMPKSFRSHGFHSDLFDGQELASVRMYRGFAETWHGFAKNAFEGLGSVGLLMFLTFVHTVAHALPFVIAALALLGLIADPFAGWLAVVACAGFFAERSVLSARFGHGAVPVLLHPAGALLMTAVQWHSFWIARSGRRSWRGRTLGEPDSEGSRPAIGPEV